MTTSDYRSWRPALIVAMVLCCTGDALAKDKLRLLKKDFDCLTTQATAYLGLPKDPLVIFLSACPIVAPTATELQVLNQNSLPSLLIREGGEVDQIIALRKADLECIVSQQAAADGVVRPTPDEDGLEATVEIDLSLCRISN